VFECVSGNGGKLINSLCGKNNEQIL
jgi:hypothetical protein